MLRRYLVLQQSGSAHDAADHSTLMEAQNVEDAANRPWNIMNGTTFNLDDTAFELSTTNLVRPVSIFKLESATEMVQAENDPALTYTILQGESSGRHKDSPPNLTDDEMVHQLLLAQANDLKEYQEILLYMYCGNLGSDDNEPVPVDDFDEENVKDAVEMIAEDHGSLIDQ